METTTRGVLGRHPGGPRGAFAVLDKNRSTAWTVLTMPTGFSVSVSKKKLQPHFKILVGNLHPLLVGSPEPLIFNGEFF